MITNDIINGLFELLGGFFVVNNCRVLYYDKSIKGVSILSTSFFTSWGMWNVYYYPTLDQWWSFFGGCSLVFTNVIYVSLMIYYKRFPGGK